MYDILFLGYEFLTEFVPFFIALLLFRRKRGRASMHFSKRYYFLILVFALYIMAVFHVTGAGTIYNARGLRVADMWERINIIPFSNRIDMVGYLLNVVMFLPFGFLVPLIWKEMGKAAKICASGIAFSLLIELSQLLSSRGTDVDDLILNTLGTAVGFLLYKGWDRVTKSGYQLENVESMQMPVYIAAMYLGRCLLFNYLGILCLVYGF